MVAIKLISEEEATGKTKEIFNEIKETLGIDFVPNLYWAMAPIPEYLEAQWNKTRDASLCIEMGKSVHSKGDIEL